MSRGRYEENDETVQHQNRLDDQVRLDHLVAQETIDGSRHVMPEPVDRQDFNH